MDGVGCRKLGRLPQAHVRHVQSCLSRDAQHEPRSLADEKPGEAQFAGSRNENTQLRTVDVAQRGVRRALGDGSPLAAGELALEAIEQVVQQFHLPLVQRCACPALPEARFDQHGIQCGLRAVDGAPERAKEP